MAVPLVIAHRGASAEKPENTLAAFRRALTAMADGIELDVHVTRDGVPVVFHDPGLYRLTGVRGRLVARTWPELATLRVLGVEPIPRLVEVLRLTRGRATVQIELKAGVPVAPAVHAIKTARVASGIVFGSFSPELLRECRRLAPNIPRMLIATGRTTPAKLLRQLRAVDASGLSVDHRAVRDSAWVRHFQSRHFTVWCWTVNTGTRLRQLAGFGVDAILTDNPALLRRELRQKS